jgi:hypothetical protein
MAWSRAALAACLVLVILWPAFSLGQSAVPAAVTSELLRTTGAGFPNRPGTKGVVYAMAFDILKPSTEPRYFAIEFQNPENSEEPFKKYGTLLPSQSEFSIESHVIKRIRNGSVYNVVVYVHSDKPKSKLLSKHIQPVQFLVPSEFVPPDSPAAGRL